MSPAEVLRRLMKLPAKERAKLLCEAAEDINAKLESSGQEVWYVIEGDAYEQ